MKAVAKINGAKFIGWENVEINSSLDILCQDYNLKAADYPVDAAKEIIAGGDVRVSIDTNLMEHVILTGYIDTTRKKRSVSTGTNVELTGRSLTCDLVDCSALYKSNTWRKTTLKQICEDICGPFGISVVTGVLDKQVDVFAIQSGEKAFEAIERLCRAFAILPLCDEYGRLQLSQYASSKADTDIVVGENVKEIEIEEDHSNRFSTYFIKGQTKGNGSEWTNDTIGLKAQAQDSDVLRYRPLLIQAESKMNGEEIQQRINWEAQVRAGRSIVTRVEWPGWMQDPFSESSRPWKINETVRVVDEEWDIDSILLVAQVSQKADAKNGKTTSLTLLPVETFAYNPSQMVTLARKSKMRIGG